MADAPSVSPTLDIIFDGEENAVNLGEPSLAMLAKEGSEQQGRKGCESVTQLQGVKTSEAETNTQTHALENANP